jgi:hypothetical protein
MGVVFQRVSYSKLSAKQQEIYNFQKVASVLAEYGFNCIKLADDWRGADFLAYHKDGDATLKVQLKGRLTVDKKYLAKDLHIAFPLSDGWCFIEHDLLVEKVRESTNWLNTNSWIENHAYSSANPSKKLSTLLEEFVLRNESASPA